VGPGSAAQRSALAGQWCALWELPALPPGCRAPCRAPSPAAHAGPRAVGVRSGIVAKRLRACGFRNVHVLDGCYRRWREQFRPEWLRDPMGSVPLMARMLRVRSAAAQAARRRWPLLACRLRPARRMLLWRVRCSAPCPAPRFRRSRRPRSSGGSQTPSGAATALRLAAPRRRQQAPLAQQRGRARALGRGQRVVEQTEEGAHGLVEQVRADPTIEPTEQRRGSEYWRL
jgi:hypothetical protein